MEHLLVLSDDIDGTRDFWCEVLGLEAGERPPLEFPGYWLYLADVPTVHVAEREAYAGHARTIGLEASGRGGDTGAIDHVAFGASDYEEVVSRLERSGVERVENTVPGAGIRQVFVEDPNGVTIEINVPPE
jgi:catechol 2,3-dioxygenase-like lactoylglutathione lyase family enzyme